MIVEELMSPLPYVVSPRDTVGDVLRVLAEAEVRHLPVVEDHALVGIVSDRDLREFSPTAMKEFDDPSGVDRLLSTPIARVMNSDVVTTHPEAEVGEAVDLMLDNKIGAVPVVEAGTQKLVGIVSYVDVLRAARDLL